MNVAEPPSIDPSSVREPSAPAPQLPPALARVPFTPGEAAAHGVGRAVLERLIREGAVIRLVRGVYLPAEVRFTGPERGAAAAAIGRRQGPIAGRLAAWVHGVPLAVLAPGPLSDPLPVEIAPRELTARRQGEASAEEPAEADVLDPVHTVLDLARRYPLDEAVALTDALLHAGAVTFRQLAEAAREAPPDAAVIRVVAASDGRATDPAESLLRLAWFAAQLPTPAVSWQVGGVRIALALPAHRFGVGLRGRWSTEQRGRLGAAGWRLVELDSERIHHAPRDYLTAHLEREFHQHLLAISEDGRDEPSSDEGAPESS